MILYIQNVNKLKKSFTLIELMLVIILITVVYSIFVPKFMNSNLKKINFSLENLNSYLIDNYQFEKSIKFTCINQKRECFVLVDEKIMDISFKNIFKKVPTVYNLDFEVIEFANLQINEFEEKDVFFEFSINNDYKFKDIIVEFEDKIIYFNSIKEFAKVYSNLDELKEMFEKNKNEVLDAF